MKAPRGLYRYVAGGDPCRIRELRDSALYDAGTEKWSYTEQYILCTDTIIWNVEIRDSQPKAYHAQIIGDSLLNYQPKEIYLRNGTPSSIYTPSGATNLEKWTLFGCSETGFSESWQEGIWTYDKRDVTPLAKEVLDVLDGKIPYDANHPLYGTWEVVGLVRNPSETKIDSIMKGLCTDYVFPFIRNVRLFYAFTPQHRYTLDSSGRLWIDKLDSDGKTIVITWEPFKSNAEQKIVLIYLNWTVHWMDQNTLLLCRDKEELLQSIPKCFVLKRKVGGESLINVLHRQPPVHI